MNATSENFAHYSALQKTGRYLAIDALENDCLYLIHSRNSHIGQWTAAQNGFVILREKLGERFLFFPCPSRVSVEPRRRPLAGRRSRGPEPRARGDT